MYASTEFKIYLFTIYCLCNLLHALQFNNKNGNKFQILSSVYDVIKSNEKKMPTSDEKQSVSNHNPNNRRYSFEDYEYGEPMDYAVAESNHE